VEYLAAVPREVLRVRKVLRRVRLAHAQSVQVEEHRADAGSTGQVGRDRDAKVIAKRKRASIEGTMVEYAHRDAVRYLVGPVGQLPLDVRGIEAERAARQVPVEAAHGAGTRVGLEDRRPEPRVARLATRPAVEPQANGIADVLVVRLGEVLLEEFARDLRAQAQIRAQQAVGLVGEARVSVLLDQLGVRRAAPALLHRVARCVGNLPDLVGLQMPERVLGVVALANRTELPQQLFQASFDALVAQQPSFVALELRECEQHEQRLVGSAFGTALPRVESAEALQQFHARQFGHRAHHSARPRRLARVAIVCALPPPPSRPPR